jgi:hypothetical protein
MVGSLTIKYYLAMKNLSALLILILTTLALVIAGCGSGSDSGSDTGSEKETLTKAEFITQADALCKKIDEREFGEVTAWTKANDKQLDGLPLEERSKRVLAAILVPSVRNEAKEIKALGIPEGDEEQLEKFFEEVDVALKKTEKEPLIVTGTLKESPFFGSYKRGRAYGFKECAEMT